jgi:hypothetical protein
VLGVWLALPERTAFPMLTLLAVGLVGTFVGAFLRPRVFRWFASNVIGGSEGERSG